MTIAIVVCGWLLASAALLGAYPGESLDIFDYVFRGWMLVELGASPLAVAPSVYTNQPFYAYITWRGQVDTYGPLWEYASGAVAWIVHHGFGRDDSHIAYIVGYRLLAVLLPAGRWALTLLPVYCLGALWSDLASSFLRGLPTRPFNATQIGAFNVLAQLMPLLCVLVVTRIWLDAP